MRYQIYGYSTRQGPTRTGLLGWLSAMAMRLWKSIRWPAMQLRKSVQRGKSLLLKRLKTVQLRKPMLVQRLNKVFRILKWPPQVRTRRMPIVASNNLVVSETNIGGNYNPPRVLTFL